MDATHSRSSSRVAVLVRRYAERVASRRYSRRTVEIYTQALERFCAFLDGKGIVRAMDVTRSDIEEYRAGMVDRQWKPASVEVFIRAIKQFFRWLEQTQEVFCNPAEGIVIRKIQSPIMPVPTEEEMTSLLATPDTTTYTGLRDRTILETAYGTGMRVEELSRLMVRDVDMVNGTVRVMGKGERERVLPLGAQAVEWLRRYEAEVGKRTAAGGRPPELWVTQYGKPLGYVAIRLGIVRHGRDSGVQTRITPHSLRRACATHMLRRGAHPVDLQMLLGHASFSHLSQYLRLTITELQAVHARSKPGS